MSFEDETDFAKQVADLNKYGQALNSCQSVEEVVSLTIEAMSLLFGTAHSSFVEVRDGDLHVVHSTNPRLSPGDEPSAPVVTAYESGERVVAEGADARVHDDSDVTAALAVPASIADEVTAVLVMRSTTRETFGETQSRPLEILASHAATAVGNIRSRERLERARHDLQNRKELIELYDRLLRHDLGNDLQVVAGFADVLVDEVDGEALEYAERIRHAARSSADLIERVGDLVSTLERQDEPEPRDLRALVETAVADVRAQHDDLSVVWEPAAFDCRVYGGELLDTVFTNLLSNAAVHNEGPVEVALSAEETDRDAVVVSVADDGSGVPPGISEDLFEMGAKGPDSDGTGFGLGFVRALTESYGGGVAVRESEAGGADFRVRLERV